MLGKLFGYGPLPTPSPTPAPETKVVVKEVVIGDVFTDDDVCLVNDIRRTLKRFVEQVDELRRRNITTSVERDERYHTAYSSGRLNFGYPEPILLNLYGSRQLSDGTRVSKSWNFKFERR